MHPSFVAMKVAVAYYQNRVSPVFDVSDRLCVVDAQDGKETKREYVELMTGNPFLRSKEILSIGTEVLICGAVSKTQETILLNAGIWVIGFTCGDVEHVINAFLQGGLMDGRFSMPGCYGRHYGRQKHNRYGNVRGQQNNNNRR